MNPGRESSTPARAGAIRPLMALAVGVVVVAIVGWWWGLAHEASAPERRGARTRLAGALAVAGLEADVVIRRDGRGIPHIEASGERDGFFGLGFSHGQDRGAQMLWLRRLALGRVAEVVGERGLPIDRVVRTLGIPHHAARAERELSPDARESLEAYAQGVDAALSRIDVDGAVPSGGVGRASTPPERWTPRDSLALLKLVNLATGASVDMGPVFGDLVEELGGVGARPLIPTGDGVRGVGLPFDHPSARRDGAERGGAAGQPLPRTASDLARSRAWLLPLAMRGRAWVLSADTSASEAPLVAADFHLAPTAPGLLHQSQLRVGEREIAGATIPGLPVYWAGRNRDIAWVLTPGRVNNMQLYRETVRRIPIDAHGVESPAPADWELEVLRGSHWRPMRVREERIAVRDPSGGIREERLEVDETDHGPVVNELMGRLGDPITVAWTGARSGDGMAALLRLPFANDASALLETLREHREPALTVVYADRAGASGWKLVGWLPRHRLWTGMLPVAGHQLAFDWRRGYDFDALPGVSSSTAGPWRIVADDPIPIVDGEPRVEWLWRTGAEGRRIDAALAKLAANGPITLRDLASMQARVVGGVNREVIGAMRMLLAKGGPVSPESAEILAILGRWDGSMAPDRRGAAAYRVLMDLLVRSVLGNHLPDPLLERYLALAWVTPDVVIEEALLEAAATRKPGGWSDPEMLTSALRKALNQTWIRLSYRRGPNREDWTWGALHELAFRPFAGGPDARVPRAWRFARVGAVSGGGGTVGIADYDPAHPFRARRATLFRMTVDLGGPDRVLTALAPGQSGNPRDRHFSDGMDPWLSGQSELLPVSPFLVAEHSVDMLVLRRSP